MRRHVIPGIMGVAITLLMIWAGIYQIDNVGLLRTVEYASYDIRLRQTLTHQADSRVVIVDIDEKSPLAPAENGRSG